MEAPFVGETGPVRVKFQGSGRWKSSAVRSRALAQSRTHSFAKSANEWGTRRYKRRHSLIRQMLLLIVLAPVLGAQVQPNSKAEPDPLAQLTGTFPGSIHYTNHGRVLEFCPDNTCHGFSGSSGVPRSTLRDFAFLYVYFYSDYYALPEWRAKEQVKHTAERVLARPSYRSCKKENDRESAGCVLLNLSRQGEIKLLFIRYDEGKRNVVREDIKEQLSEKAPSSQP